ncbi:MAG TPA: hypothetical protein VN577_06930 [Terriglobales bacterium]|nr:hypothetical protein [Terriglobales bacterium]
MSSSTATKPAVAAPIRIPRTTTLLFAFTSFLSAFLLFQVQLIVSKHILPWFGGSAAVWTTSMLVFQVLLLGGYFYSHTVSARLSAEVQTKVHVGLLGLSFLAVAVLSFVWPSAITPGNTWRPMPSDSPAASVALIILLAAGLPYFVLSTTGPLLQSWFGRLVGDARTYRLYSVSNMGSLLGLLSFPFLFEPMLRLKLQGQIWAVLFCSFTVACAYCALKARSAESAQWKIATDTNSFAASSPWLPVLWFLLAACASALLLATTNLICEEIITVPLLWVFPLAIYLLSFILCFDHPRWYKRAIFQPLFVISLFLTCAALIYEQVSARLITVPVLLFSACMVCHGELVRLKPNVQKLTSFYLAVSAGGAAGGVFVGIIAPHIFNSFAEFQLVLALTVILVLLTLYRDESSWIFRTEPWIPVLVIVGTVLVALASTKWIPGIVPGLETIRFYPLTLLLGIITVMGAVVLRGSFTARRGFRFVQIPMIVIAIAAMATLYLSAQPKPGLFSSTRNFYGVVRVLKTPGITQIVHGQTIHGAQLDPPLDRTPIAYYGASSGVSIVLRNHPSRGIGQGNLRIGVVGLGAGALAGYAHFGDTIRYYEINPDVVKLSTGDRPVFTFIRNSQASITTVLGDARLSMELEAASGRQQQFDMLVLDAFAGDAIPVHLLTKEAFDTYWKHLNPETGVIAVHITSRHVNLVPVVKGAAEYFHAPSLLTFNRGNGYVFDSLWFLMSRNPDLLTIPELNNVKVEYVHNVGPRLWTDDYSDIFRLLY